jgi:hypothetical protein
VLCEPGGLQDTDLTGGVHQGGRWVLVQQATLAKLYHRLLARGSMTTANGTYLPQVYALAVLGHHQMRLSALQKVCAAPHLWEWGYCMMLHA